MTDPEICIAALTDWPVEARPKRVIACDHILTARQYLTVFGRDNEDDIAIALFAAAGMEWLLKDAGMVTLFPPCTVDDYTSGFRIEVQGEYENGEQAKEDVDAEGPTLLSAIDAAIRSIK